MYLHMVLSISYLDEIIYKNLHKQSYSFKENQKKI